MPFHPALCTESQCLTDMGQVGSQYGFKSCFIVTQEAAHLDVAMEKCGIDGLVFYGELVRSRASWRVKDSRFSSQPD